MFYSFKSPQLLDHVVGAQCISTKLTHMHLHGIVTKEQIGKKQTPR